MDVANEQPILGWALQIEAALARELVRDVPVWYK